MLYRGDKGEQTLSSLSFRTLPVGRKSRKTVCSSSLRAVFIRLMVISP